MNRPWLVRIVVDTDGRATEAVALTIRERLETWRTATVDTVPVHLIHVTATTEPVTRSEAQDIGAYLETAVRAACRECRCEYAVVRLTSVE